MHSGIHIEAAGGGNVRGQNGRRELRGADEGGDALPPLREGKR